MNNPEMTGSMRLHLITDTTLQGDSLSIYTKCPGMHPVINLVALIGSRLMSLMSTSL